MEGDAVKSTNAIGFCLQCDEWRDFRITTAGWWRPQCRFWNPSKSTKECKYGPRTGCKYTLEFCLLDNRRGFKLCDGQSFLPLVQFLDDNRDDIAMLFQGGAKYDKALFIFRKEDFNDSRISVSFMDMLEWVNDTLRRNGRNVLSHYRKYDQIVKDKGSGKWVSARIEEKIVS